MSKNKNASMEARLKNNKDLVTFISEYIKYGPTSDEIKKENYGSFVNEVDAAMTVFNNSYGLLSTEQKENNALFKNMVKISKSIRSEIGEVKGNKSSQYGQVNSLVKLITGENISIHNKTKKEKAKELKEGEEIPGSSSVSQLDQKSMLGNFRQLNALLRSFTFYAPSDESLTIASLETMETALTESLARTTAKETAYTNERSRMMHYFNDKGGLRDRARRAKMHVRRKYGANSPEYKALVNKKY